MLTPIASLFDLLSPYLDPTLHRTILAVQFWSRGSGLLRIDADGRGNQGYRVQHEFMARCAREYRRGRESSQGRWVDDQSMILGLAI